MLFMQNLLGKPLAYGAPPPFKAATTGGGNGSSAVTTPSNVPGDMLIALLSVKSGTPIAPSGWTLLATTNEYQVYWKVAVSGELASNTWGTSVGTANGQWQVVIASYGQSSAVNVFGVGGGNTDTIFRCSSVTTTVKGCLLLVVGWDNGGGIATVTDSTPATTLRTNLHGGYGNTLLLDRPAAYQGPTGSTTLTVSARGSLISPSSIHIAIRAG